MKNKKTDQIDEIREDPFGEYIKLGEPDKADKAYAWQTAIGLQDVDQLRPSEYLLNTAKENIDGNISIDEVRKRIDSYYEESAFMRICLFWRRFFGTFLWEKRMSLRTGICISGGIKRHIYARNNTLNNTLKKKTTH